MTLLTTAQIPGDFLKLSQEAEKLGVQGLLILMTLVLGYLLLKGQSRGDKERKANQEKLEKQYDALMEHHAEVANQYKTERAGIAEERERHFETVVRLQGETNAVVGANTQAILGVAKSIETMTHTLERIERDKS